MSKEWNVYIDDSRFLSCKQTIFYSSRREKKREKKERKTNKISDTKSRSACVPTSHIHTYD